MGKRMDQSIICHDVIIIGGGVAGLRAAIAAYDAGVDVGIISKVHPIRSASVGAQGGIAASLNNAQDDDTWLQHFQDTLHSGAGLCDEEPVRILCEEGPKAILELDAMGVLFDRFPDNRIAQRPYGGHSHIRACYAGDKTGHTIVHTLWGQCVKRKIPFYLEWYVWRLIRERGRIAGLLALDITSGLPHLVKTKAVVLATGGIGQVFAITTNPFASTGDGLILASEAGARLRDMEFIQFHPTGLYPRGVLISEACRAEGGYLVNRDGKRFMFDYDARGELATRDIVSRGIQTEIDANRGMERKNYVGLDVRHLGREVLEHKLPIAVELARDLGGIDLAKQILPVAPTAHYFMGGIAASCNCEVYEQKRNNSKKNFAETKSVIPGLFAAGECACLSVHGANRLGCNSLLDAVVYGKRSGEQSAAYARTVNYQPIAGSQLREFAAVVDGERHRNAQGRSSGQIRADLQQGMTERCGIFRSKRRLNEQIQAIQTLQSELETVRVSYKDGWAQTVVEKKELATMLAVALLVVESALAREGSVGAHWRVDTK